MTRKRTDDRKGHAHSGTCSCSRRRRLDYDRPKKVVLGVLNYQVASQCGKYIGFVVRPDAVPAIVLFPDPDPIHRFVKPWKPRSSVPIQRLLRGTLSSSERSVDLSAPVVQARCFDFNESSARKVEEKLVDVHQDPVRDGLAAHRCDGRWSSARSDEQGGTVGVPVGRLD
jgi:hypothetical protein